MIIFKWNYKFFKGGDVVYMDVDYGKIKEINNELMEFIDTHKYNSTRDWAFNKVIDTKEKLDEIFITGWKIHVSPTFDYMMKTLNLVDKYCNDNDIHFKFIKDVNIYKNQCIEGQNRYQRGKFIVIYPITDNEALKIVEDLHQIFEDEGLNDNSFFNVKNDFKIYPGIYTRLTHYFDKNGISREFVGVLAEDLEEHISIINKTRTIPLKITRYEYPFKELRFRNKLLPKNMFKCCDLLGMNKIITTIRESIEQLTPGMLYMLHFIDIAVLEYINDLKSQSGWETNSQIFDEINILENIRILNLKDEILNSIRNGAKIDISDKFNKLVKLKCLKVNFDMDFINKYKEQGIINEDEYIFGKKLIETPKTRRILSTLSVIFNQGSRIIKFNEEESKIYNFSCNELESNLSKLEQYINAYNYINKDIRNNCTKMIKNINSEKFKYEFDYEDKTDENYKNKIINIYGSIIDDKDILKFEDINEKQIYDCKECDHEYFEFLEPINIQLNANNLPLVTQTINNTCSVDKKQCIMNQCKENGINSELLNIILH
jgi:hypothetical protein